MADERRGAGGGDVEAEVESWTEMEDTRPDLVEAVPIRHGMVLGGRYAIEKIIGRGGSGVVVRAYDRDLRQVVAIKIVRAELAGQRMWASRLAREVRLARQIHHPHVCRVFDFQQAEGRAFLVMELAENGTLREEIRSGALTARPLAARIADARAVASALAAIHAAGIVHRDLTPQNLLRMSDGRVVVTDFGLAVDVSDSTSSVHGGTVAYMAPEVVRGGKSTFASDIWALGVVMHEMVFGAKPRWSEGGAPEMRAPELGRKLTGAERAVLDACRACTAKEPARRIASAAEAGRLLTARRSWWARLPGRPRQPLIFAATLTLMAATAVGVLRARRTATDARAPVPAAESALIVPTGEAADWTDISTVLAEVPERITCTRPLPDKRTIRFVWGTPPRAEDVDTVTRKRVPSPLVPAAYAEGCPDMSPDGKRLVFQGHTKDGRAFAFLSEHPDGRDAEAVVPTAEPTMSSEPTWLSDGQNFSFDVDSKHMGVFATKERRLTVLPEPMGGKALTSFRNVSGGLLFVSGFSPSEETDVIGLSWSPFREEMRFRFSVAAMDVTVGHGSKVYFTDPDGKRFRQVNELDRSTRIARRLGRVRGQIVRDLSVLADGLAFLSARVNADLFVVTADKGISRVTQDGSVFFGASCGNDFIVSRDDGRQLVIQRLDLTGRVLETRAAPGFAPGCSPDGSVFYYVMSASRAVVRCDRHGCGQLPSPMAMNLSVSPDGTRLAILSWAAHEPAVSWIASDGSGSNHFVSESETGCRPGWATAQTLWISRRREGKVVWVEVDADSGRETGKNVPGGRDCADGDDDPLSPVDRDVRIVFDRKSQLRLIAGDQMARN